MHGRLQFLAGQILWRLARKAFAVATRHAYTRTNNLLDGETTDALRLYKTFLTMDERSGVAMIPLH